MKHFTLEELYNMLEEYQKFTCNDFTITSPIHANGPDMCRQLIWILKEKEEEKKLNKI